MREKLAETGRRVRGAGRPNLVERRMSRFLREPPSVRTAAGVIVTATAVVVVTGGVAMRLLDHAEYKNVWVGMWWALQTVTTVGYGDVTPARHSGRIVASFFMLYGVAFLAIVTAAITSTFVARAQKERLSAAAEDMDDARSPEAMLGELTRRFDTLEELLRRVEEQMTLLEGRSPR